MRARADSMTGNKGRIPTEEMNCKGEEKRLSF
jgi:hypothetical protein